VKLASGRRSRKAVISAAPYASPDASPAEMKIRGLDFVTMYQVYLRI
jgi:hypothetical protein